MRGLVNHEKRNLLAITLVYTIVICFYITICDRKRYFRNCRSDQ